MHTVKEYVGNVHTVKEYVGNMLLKNCKETYCYGIVRKITVGTFPNVVSCENW